MSLYLNLLCERDLEKASKIQRDLPMLSPSDLIDLTGKDGWTEEDCL